MYLRNTKHNAIYTHTYEPLSLACRNKGSIYITTQLYIFMLLFLLSLSPSPVYSIFSCVAFQSYRLITPCDAEGSLSLPFATAEIRVHDRERASDVRSSLVANYLV
jgi:hypothetical protein